MAVRGLTGSRIRERRAMAGIKQAALARTVGISAAYLNLIEHNRRRIGGKLLTDIAEALGVEAGALAEGAEAGLVTELRAAASGLPEAAAETVAAEEFAGRFPGWAALVAAQAQRIATLERTVAGLTDRMAHDPHLAASLHDVLTTVTAINSTASILVDTAEIEAEWRDRFHRNIHEDSQRLAESSRALVAYFDEAGQQGVETGTPQEELEHWLDARGYHIAELERALPPPAAALLREAPQIGSVSGQVLCKRYVARYRADAEKMPAQAFQAAIADTGTDPLALAAAFGADLAAVLRRIAALPALEAAGAAGLVVCDGSGTLTFRKPVDGFALPRFGTACPLWPLYQALSRPMVPIRALVEMTGRDAMRFLTYAVAQPVQPSGFDAPQVFEATMLILPADRAAPPDLPVQQIGTSCRICPTAACVARREPSILADGDQGDRRIT